MRNNVPAAWGALRKTHFDMSWSLAQKRYCPARWHPSTNAQWHIRADEHDDRQVCPFEHSDQGRHTLMQPLLSQAVVTGGNSGIGAETVRALATAGARVILTSRDPSAGQAVADRLQEEAHGLKVRYSAWPRVEKVQGSFTYARVFAHSGGGGHGRW